MSWTCPNCRAEIESDFGLCWDCRRAPPSLTDRRRPPADEVDPNLVVNGPPWPVAHVCPECGNGAYREVRAVPWIWAGLWKDRICRRCRVRFRPPVPGWAVAVYLASAALLVGPLLALLAVPFVPGWNPARVQVICVPVAFLACHVFCVMTLLRD